MTYSDALEFLYSHLPMYSRIGPAAYRKDLNNIRALCDLLDHPEKKFRSIHIAGTNGKGSTSHMLAAVLQSARYKTGLFTSPHLKDFRERIRINGEMISKDEVVEFVNRYKDEVLKIGCSFFEWTTGLAFYYFAKQQVDVAVIETGLGGRLDSTNVITPIISVITNISDDHSDLLGDTLEKIAGEKAGIIKPEIPVVIGEHQDESIMNVFNQRATGCESRISCAADQWTVISYVQQKGSLEVSVKRINSGNFDLSLDLTGNYQEQNVLTVLESLFQLDHEVLHIPEEAITSGLSAVKKLTGLRGRWEILHEKPLVIADVGHNKAGIGFSIRQLQLYHYRQLRFVLGFVKEKDILSILQLFPKDAVYYFCKPDIPRGLDVNILFEKAKECDLNGRMFDSVQQAYLVALKDAGEEDLIYVGGSTFVVSEII